MKRKEVENKIRQKALTAAISKAKNLISILKSTTLGEPLSISEGHRSNCKNYDDLDDGFGFGGGAPQSPIAAGIIEISVDITAIFGLINK